ncbi:MAG: hypothetical protein AB8B57_01630 [Congregibacter sp.]
MFTNKHIAIAVIVAPLLAIAGWYAVGNISGEKAMPAQPGQIYPLIASSNCRYASGECELTNNDLKLHIRAQGAGVLALELRASHPLEAILMSVTDPGTDEGPSAMLRLDSDGLRWSYPLQTPPRDTDLIRLVAARAGSSYFAQAPTVFLLPEDTP